MNLNKSYRSADHNGPDYYATPPLAVYGLLMHEQFSEYIYEPCCGQGYISEVLREAGYVVEASDLYDYGYAQSGVDFLERTEFLDGDLITNPPYNNALTFVEHGLKLLKEGHKAAFFLRLAFLEGQKRKTFYKQYPPYKILVSSSRLGCAPNGAFLKDRNGILYYPSAVAYAWFIWEKPFAGPTIIDWFN